MDPGPFLLEGLTLTQRQAFFVLALARCAAQRFR